MSPRYIPPFGKNGGGRFFLKFWEILKGKFQPSPNLPKKPPILPIKLPPPAGNLKTLLSFRDYVNIRRPIKAYYPTKGFKSLAPRVSDLGKVFIGDIILFLSINPHMIYFPNP